LAREVVGQPGQGGELHPGAGQRDDLSDEVEPVVTVPQGPEGARAPGPAGGGDVGRGGWARGPGGGKGGRPSWQRSERGGGGEAGGQVESGGVAVGLDLLVEEPDQLLEQLQVLGAGDRLDLPDQLAAALDAADERLDAEGGQRPAGALEGEQLVQLVGRELPG